MKLSRAEINDIPFLLEGFHGTHHGLSHADVGDYEKRLHTDVFSKTPKAYVYMLEDRDKKIGYVLYAFCYFASMGSVLWISQLYIAPKYRGRHLRECIRLLKTHTKEIGAKRLIWCSDTKETRLPNLWKRGKAKDLNPLYTFWAINPEN